MKKGIIWGAGIVIGATAGYFYWYFVGCASGSCAITSSPVNSTLYGGLMGALLVNVFSTTRKRRPGEMKKHDQICQKIHSGKGIFSALTIIIILVIIGCGRNDKDSRQTAKAVPIPDSIYKSEGNRIITLTFDTLRNSLLHAISSQGMDSAIRFCNENAYPLTDTYADSVIIRRTALRHRNPGNSPDSLEQVVLHEMTAAMDSGRVSGVRIIRQPSSQEVHFFKPILLQSMCLNCHGTPGKEIQPSTMAGIQKLYPDDRAINFKQGDLRGVWHIIFKPQK